MIREVRKQRLSSEEAKKPRASIKLPRRVLRTRKERPEFRRQESWRYVRLEDSWRRPRGKDSKTRLQVSGWPPLVKVGYRSPRNYRSLHPSGFKEVLVCSEKELIGLNPTIHAVRISGRVGRKNKLKIYEAAKSAGLRVLNPPRGVT